MSCVGRNGKCHQTLSSGGRDDGDMGCSLGCCSLGCCTSSSSAWEAAATDGWSVYTIRRTASTPSRFSIEVIKCTRGGPPDGGAPATCTRGGSECGSAPATAEPAPLLQLQVQLFLSSSGRVHAGYVHPAQVHFGEKSALAYDAKKRSLSSESCVYQRAKAQSYNLCAYDTRWSLTSREDVPGRGGGGAGIPSELSVVNNDGRVAVFRGRHKGAYDDDASSRAQDLLARVPDTDGCIPPDWSCDREFELLLHPELEQSASTSLPLLLAICTEGFWSQGSICHGMYSDYGDDSHGGAVDRVALLENTSCPDVRRAHP